MADLIQNDPYKADLKTEDFPRVDGTGHNLGEPAFGGVGTRYRQVTPTAYEDGLYSPAGSNRPSARLISNELFNQTSSIPDDRRLTAMTWIFGQFVNHEIDNARGGTEPFPIAIPADDPQANNPAFVGALQGFRRNAIDPDTGTAIGAVPGAQINTASSWIDGELLYGNNTERANFLRTFQGGKLKTSDGDLLPFNTANLPNDNFSFPPKANTDLFLAGDPRANQQVGLTSIHTVFLREHNRIADQLAAAHSTWTDEQIFQRARSIVIAELQAITYNEYLPALLGSLNLPGYKGYDPNNIGGTNLTFATAAFRMGHSQVDDFFYRMGADGQPKGDIPLAQAFFNPDRFKDPAFVDDILRGASAQLAEAVDTKVVSNFRNSFLDQVSTNIQRGRDQGLADYNTLRRTLNTLGDNLAQFNFSVPPTPPITSFAELTSDPSVRAKLEELYGSVDNIDMWVGMLAEDHVPGSSLGLIAGTMIKLTFQRLRDGDRFFYKNPVGNGGLFTPEEAAEIDKSTLSDIIERNTNITGLQDNIFMLTPLVNNGSETIRGGLGEDIIDKSSLSGNNLLFGKSANDTLVGGTGNDTLVGGTQNDYLTGGTGNDVFVFQSGDGTDVISDFSSGDLIGLLPGLTFSGLTISQGTSSHFDAIDSSSNTLIKVSQTGELLASLLGVSANAIGASSFSAIASLPV